VLLANCLAHGRRQIVEVAENFQTNRDTCWRHWAPFIAMMRSRSNGNCLSSFTGRISNGRLKISSFVYGASSAITIFVFLSRAL
jgi:hypothetical protein